MLVNYRFWNKIRNCGDAIMAYLLQDVIGATPVRVDADVPHLLGVGSIFFLANEHSHVWGSGVLRPEHLESAKVPPEHIYAVRGKRTLEVLRAKYPEIGDLPVGDPGLLVDYLLEDPPFRRLETKYAMALVPHYRSFELPEFVELAKRPDVCLVDMRDSSLRPVRQIQQSELVVSQSLHGLIFASALGKRNVWVSEPGRDENWAFKYMDWFSTVDNPQPEPLPIGSDFATLAKAAEARNVAIDRQALLDAFPMDAVGVADGGPILDFRSSRGVPAVLIRSDWLAGLADPEGVVDAASIVESAAGRELTARVRDLTAKFFSDWSEMPYVCIAPSQMRVNERLLNRVAQYLDRKPTVDALVMIPKSTLAEAGATAEGARRGAGLEVTQSLQLLGGMLVLRPSTVFNFKRRIWNAFY